MAENAASGTLRKNNAAFMNARAVNVAILILPSTVRTDNAPKVRFSATLGQEPEIEVALVRNGVEELPRCLSFLYAVHGRSTGLVGGCTLCDLRSVTSASIHSTP
jgi:hypothetical protein